MVAWLVHDATSFGFELAALIAAQLRKLSVASGGKQIL
jgi:hypothetical protein